MPNWCNNDVKITGKLEYIKELEKACNEGKFFDFVKPMPEELNNLESPIRDAEVQARILETYGVKDWYDWAVKNWGSKWEVKCDSIQRIGNELRLSFDSAWSPPIGIYEELFAKDGKVDSITALYYEGGCNFCGKWEDGEDTHLDVSRVNLSSEVGQEIDVAFNITEDRNMWLTVGYDVIISDEYNGQEFTATITKDPDEEGCYTVVDSDEVVFEVPMGYVGADF